MRVGTAWRNTVHDKPLMTIDVGPLRERDAVELAQTYVDSAVRCA